MENNVQFPEISSYIENKDLAELKEFLQVLQPPELADIIKYFPPDEQIVILENIPLNLATKTFEFLKFSDQKKLLNHLNDELIAHILNNMAPDDRTELLGYLPNTVVKELIGILSDEERVVTLSLLGYPENSVGRLMTPDYITVKKDWTIKEALDYIRTNGSDSETLNVVYVTDDRGILIDDIRSRELLLAPLDKKVSDVMDSKYVFLKTNQGTAEAIELFQKHARTVLPVIDDTNLLIGIVTIDDILNVLQKEDTREMQNLGGSEALEEPYMATPLFQMVKKRAVWLVILFVGEMLTATAMGFFEDEIAKAVVLALFIPLIISSGGNSGSQATSLIIRAMALREIKLSDWWKIMKREVLSGLMLGTILGTIGFIRISVWSMFSDVYGAHWLLIAFTVGFSLVLVVLWGSLSGSMLPLILRKLKFDPAKSSAPFVATLVDVTGLVIYFGVAILFLSGTLL
jgi:magnesium transporter